jgi:L-threonylcarbamoyladenylate synthase
MRRIIPVQFDTLSKKMLQEVINSLKQGGIIVYPTETAYGIGCDAFNKHSIRKIFGIKKRPKNQPLAILVSSKEMAQKVAVINHQIEKLMVKYHPGPLVIAAPKKEVIPNILNKQGIAFRISSNYIASLLVKSLGRPIVSTSANTTGNATPYSIDQVIDDLDQNKIDLLLDAGRLPKIAPSTLIDFTLQPAPQIIREGTIKGEEILDFLGIPKEQREEHYAR